MDKSTILCDRPQAEILGDVGLTLLHIKNARGLTLEEMGAQIHRTRESVAQYIAGEAEMGFVTWERAKEAWPELVERMSESATERSLRSKQVPLDLDQPVKRRDAA